MAGLFRVRPPPTRRKLEPNTYRVGVTAFSTVFNHDGWLTMSVDGHRSLSPPLPRWPVVVDHYLWAVCFVPGVLGVLLSFNSCRNSHHHCKPTVEVEQEEQRRRGPHACALPAYIVLLLSVLVALGMHASGLLFCEVSRVFLLGRMKRHNFYWQTREERCNGFWGLGG